MANQSNLIFRERFECSKQDLRPKEKTDRKLIVRDQSTNILIQV